MAAAVAPGPREAAGQDGSEAGRRHDQVAVARRELPENVQASGRLILLDGAECPLVGAGTAARALRRPDLAQDRECARRPGGRRILPVPPAEPPRSGLLHACHCDVCRPFWLRQATEATGFQ